MLFIACLTEQPDYWPLGYPSRALSCGNSLAGRGAGLSHGGWLQVFFMYTYWIALSDKMFDVVNVSYCRYATAPTPGPRSSESGSRGGPDRYAPRQPPPRSYPSQESGNEYRPRRPAPAETRWVWTNQNFLCHFQDSNAKRSYALFGI